MNNRHLFKPGKYRKLCTLWIVTSGFSAGLCAQQPGDSLLQQATLQNVIQYAVTHQPAAKQSEINQQITEATIKSKLADWFPQLEFDYSFQHNFQVQTAIIGGNAIKLGVDNTSSAQFNVSQNIFNRDALLASRTAGEVRNLSRQLTSNTKIDVAVNASKAFYDVLAIMQQIRIAAEDTIRLGRSLRVAFNQYQAGVTDKIDYKRATIALNNTTALLKSNQEVLKARLDYLKSIMGYPSGEPLNIIYDSLQMENEIALDTLQAPDYTRRIEYQVLLTRKKLQESNIKYQKWAYLPNVSAFGAYHFNFQNNQFSKVYRKNFPNSYAGLTLSLPIFQGGKRKYDIQAAELQVKLIDWDIVDLKNNINAEYSQALARYKGFLANYVSLKENMNLAREVYDVINLQYRSGIKTYLEVITAETDLRSSRINYYIALNQLLAAKVDVQRALGEIRY